MHDLDSQVIGVTNIRLRLRSPSVSLADTMQTLNPKPGHSTGQILLTRSCAEIDTAMQITASVLQSHITTLCYVLFCLQYVMSFFVTMV